MAQSRVEIKIKTNGKWEILVDEKSTGKEYINQHNALYYAVRKADSIGENIVTVPQQINYFINRGEARYTQLINNCLRKL